MLGAGVASLVWFVSLMLSGLFLRKFIQKIIVWQWIERLTVVLMFVIAINCIRLLINF